MNPIYRFITEGYRLILMILLNPLMIRESSWISVLAHTRIKQPRNPHYCLPFIRICMFIIVYIYIMLKILKK